MRKILVAGAALALIASSPAFAQLGGVGGVTGQVGGAVGGPVGGTVGGGAGGTAGGSVSTPMPDTGAATSTATGAVKGTTDAAKGTVGGAKSAAGDTVSDTKSTVGKTASANANLGSSASANSKGVNASATVGASTNLTPGAALQNNAGKDVGKVVSVARNGAGKIKSVVIETADGAKHVIPGKAFTMSGDAAVTTYSDAQISAAPAPK